MIYKEFSRSVYMNIARRCGSEQVVRDVDFARFMYFKGLKNVHFHQYSRRIDTDAFIVAYFNTAGCHIIGIGVAEASQGKGLAGQLMRDLIGVCRKIHIHKIQTRTNSGIDFYRHYGFKCIRKQENWSKTQKSKKSEDYLMELKI